MYKQTFEQKLITKGEYNPWQYVCNLYKKGLSCEEISEKLHIEQDIAISGRYLAIKIKEKIGLRSKSERFKNAIARGRMIYYKKPENEKYKRTGLSQKIRMLVLKRDKFKCILCGNNPATGSTLEIHHINGKQNDLDNLQTLCFECHRGLHYTKEAN